MVAETMVELYLFTLSALVLSCSAASHNATVFVPPVYSYLLPPLYQGGNESTQFLTSTATGNSTVDALISSASKAPFVAFDQEFYSIFGNTPELILAAESTLPSFYEVGVWDPRRNHVWFAGSVQFGDYNLYVLDLETFNVTSPTLGFPVAIPNGGYYFNDTVYVVDFGNQTWPGGIVSVDPATYNAEPVVNSFYGLRFNSPDDVTIVKRNGQEYLFFTDPSFGPATNTTPPALLPNGVWRYHAAAQDLQAVISRGDILNPNGIAVNANMTKLYVTDTPEKLVNPSYGPGAFSSGATAIYVFDLDDEVRPINKRLFAYNRSGIPDGLHIDDAGRVWTGEGDGIVIRSSTGKVVGLVNAAAIGEESVTNFALAGNVLAIGGHHSIWLVNLTSTIVSPERFYP